MKTVKLDRNVLLNKVKGNYDKHISEYNELLANFRHEMKDRLMHFYDKYNSTDELPEIKLPPKPRVHTKDYETVIAMLELSIDDNIVLEWNEFRNYVLDEWEWKHDFDFTKAFYGVR